MAGSKYEIFKNLDPIIKPELKEEDAVTAINIGIVHATGPIVFAATLYKNVVMF